MPRCEKCGVEFAEGTVHVCAPSSEAPVKCPECGAEFDGDSVSHSSEKLGTLAEENAALKTELEAAKADASQAKGDLEKEKKKSETQPAPKTEQKKRRMIFGASKRAA